MKPVTVLRRTRKLIEKPERWIKRHFAVNANGDTVLPRSRNACSFCVRGAFRRITSNMEERRASADYVRRVLPSHPVSLIVWNDNPRRTHKQVLRALDRAIALAEKEAQS